MSLPLNIKTPKLNKTNLIKAFPNYSEMEEIKAVHAIAIVEFIKTFTVLRMQNKLLEEGITISDLFNRPKEVTKILSKFVEYPYSPNAKTKYCGYTEKVPYDQLFIGFSSIRESFIKEKADDMICALREVGLL